MTADAPAPAIVACTALPESATYIGAVRDRAYARWVVPEDFAGNEPVVIAFQLDTRGNLTFSEVRSSPSRDAGESARQALVAASPYPPMPDTVKCLADRRLIAKFSVAESLPASPPDQERSADASLFLKIFVGSSALSMALLTAVLWRASRRGTDQVGEVSEGAEVLRLEPGEEQVFFRARWRQVVEVVALLHSLLFFAHGPVMIVFFVLGDVALLWSLWRARREPVLRLTTAEIEAPRGRFGRGTMLTQELASWATTRSQLVLRSARGEELSIALAALSDSDRKKVLALVRALPLASSAEPPLSAADIGRRQFRRTLGYVSLGVVIAIAVLAASVWLAAHPL